MAEIDEALTTYLLSKTALTTLIDRRLYPDVLPKNCALPAVMVWRVVDNKIRQVDKIATLEAPNYQYNCYATTKAMARLVANQIRTALSDYQGTISGVVVQAILLINELDGVETNTDGTIKTYWQTQEYEIYFEKG